MDLYASAALTGLGYSLSKERDSLKDTEQFEQVHPNEKPSHRNVYASSIVANTRAEELQRGTTMWNKSQNPLETGIAPRPAYADQFAYPNLTDNIDSTTVQSLSGNMINSSEFKHNNMQPYMRMKELPKYNEGFDNNTQRLEVFTGRGSEIKKKWTYHQE